MAKRAADSENNLDQRSSKVLRTNAPPSTRMSASIFESVLDDSLKRAKEVHAKQLGDTRNFFASIPKKIIPLRTSSEDEFDVELEARFGKIAGKSFHPELAKTEFDQLHAYLDGLQAQGIQSWMEVHWDFVYTLNDGQNIRLSFANESEAELDPSTSDEYEAMKKEKVEKLDLRFQADAYDVRLSLATEKQIQVPFGLDRKKYDLLRKKKRTVFEHEDKEGSGEMWKIDLTVVETIASGNRNVSSSSHQANKQGTISYEAEIELDKSLFEDFKNKPIPKETIEKFFSKVEDILRELGKAPVAPKEALSSQLSPFPEVKEVLVDNDLTEKLRDRVSACFTKEGYVAGFPGSMPVNFSRQAFPTVITNDYRLSEKTDGVRYMFLICPEGTFITNRSYNFYRVPYDGLKELFAKDGKCTLLDGELIRRFEGGILFLVFDVVAINDVMHHKKDLDARYQAIAQEVVKPFRDWRTIYETRGAEMNIPFTVPFDIMSKIFWPKERIADFFAGIKIDHKGNRYYRDQKRYHKTDGIILTPTVPYLLKRAPTLFKWKYSDLQTIDFTCELSEEPEHFHLHCGLPNDEEFPVFSNVTFPPEDLHRLKVDWNLHHCKTKAIIEVKYDPELGWRYYCMRPDKDVPNFITTFADTLLGMVGPVTQHELIDRIVNKKIVATPRHPQSHSQHSQQPRPPQPAQQHSNTNNNHHGGLSSSDGLRL